MRDVRCFGVVGTGVIGAGWAARALARRAGVEMPIVQEVHRILHEDGRPQAGLDRLLSRPLTSEEGSVKTTGA